ncbi:MAG: hypothetical protein R3F43_19985 [bacterium]
MDVGDDAGRRPGVPDHFAQGVAFAGQIGVEARGVRRAILCGMAAAPSPVIC